MNYSPIGEGEGAVCGDKTSMVPVQNENSCFGFLIEKKTLTEEMNYFPIECYFSCYNFHNGHYLWTNVILLNAYLI